MGGGGGGGCCPLSADSTSGGGGGPWPPLPPPGDAHATAIQNIPLLPYFIDFEQFCNSYSDLNRLKEELAYKRRMDPKISTGRANVFD